jgi:hypothetical protein
MGGKMGGISGILLRGTVEKFKFNVEKFFPPDTIEMSKNLIDEKLGSIKAVNCCSLSDCNWPASETQSTRQAAGCRLSN